MSKQPVIRSIAGARPAGDQRPRRPSHPLGPGAVVAAVLALQACAVVGPDYTPPEVRLPDQWHQELLKARSPAAKASPRDGTLDRDAAGQDVRQWWTVFRDPVLDRLVAAAASGNLDSKRAVARIAAARANVGFARGEELPAVTAPGSVEFGRVSEGTSPVLGGRNRTDTQYSVGLDATWEVDLWGRIARSVEAADADLQASVEDWRDVLVSLYAEVADRYVQVRTLQGRIDSALGNVRTQQRTLRLVRDRVAAGLASDLEVAQARLNLARTESAVPLFRRQLAEQVHALGVLLREAPAALYPVLDADGAIPEPPATVAVGAPRDLLRQRPDIRRAERDLAAQTARIGVVTADLYPRFSLLGFFAFQSFSAGTVFNGNSLAYGLGPQVSWNVFDGGRVRSRISAEDALTQEALVSYEQTVLFALREVEDAIANFVEEQRRRDALARSVAAARDAVSLVETLYVTGLTDFQNVQDTQRNLFEQEDLLTESEGNVTRFLVQIYRALGGGWDPDSPVSAPPAAAASTPAAATAPAAVATARPRL